MSQLKIAQHLICYRFEFDRLPHLVSPGWNLDNLEYPAEAITIESIGVAAIARFGCESATPADTVDRSASVFRRSMRARQKNV